MGNDLTCDGCGLEYDSDEHGDAVAAGEPCPSMACTGTLRNE